ncbi:NAD(P)H-binding protein [Stackebrandtia nassauensis]|uniref:NmrA family protein n=1 Tax=Stackebrandtia nassauensis (strain DSM 44728 / CIP 108903 / NRRL B-16338 / NBRC 102104 / LLR-40K-21) TaxID=446470 RepID=D3Q098_STANL|nr:NAD(P)H-binding protein [Stackebrandtia nassauensis]ADD45627.1 NmrA family protein [Stackebrandtia nassauensis DSM 44728]
MTVLVTGASGNIGSRVVSTLADTGFAVRAAAREAAALEVPDGVETVSLDIGQPGDATAVLDGVDTIFLYPIRSGSPEALLAAAREAGVRHVVLLSSPGSWDAGEHDRVIGQVHQGIERTLSASGLDHTVLYPSWLASNARRDWANDIRDSGRVRLAFADAHVNPIHIDDVAEVAADLLTRERFRGRMQVLTGPESMRLRDVVSVLGEALDRPIGLDELTREQALAERPPHLPEAVLETLLDVMAAAVDVPALVNNNVERITGHPARPFGQWVSEQRVAFAA